MNKEMTTPLLIISIVFDYFGIPIEIRDKKTRKGEKVTACQYSMYFLRRYTRLSQAKIGMIFRRDHATVIHACKKLNFEYRHYKDTYYDIEIINTLILSEIIPDEQKYLQYDTDKI